MVHYEKKIPKEHIALKKYSFSGSEKDLKCIYKQGSNW